RQATQGVAETDTLLMRGFNLRLDDDEVQITVGSCIAPRMRSDQDHPRPRCRTQQATRRLDDGGLSNHAGILPRIRCQCSAGRELMRKMAVAHCLPIRTSAATLSPMADIVLTTLNARYAHASFGLR